jgi:very-short-patch-repair endonuclease
VVKYERPPLATSRARAMRRSPTDAEQRLWLLLRDRRIGGFKFRRQFPIGPYIADFVCLRRKFVVEADGGQHADSSADLVRDRWFAGEGYTVVRYPNNEILANSEGVLSDLCARLGVDLGAPSPGSALRAEPPSPPRGRG